MPEILSGQMLLKKKHDFNKQRGKEQYAFKIFDLVSYAQLVSYAFKNLVG